MIGSGAGEKELIYVPDREKGENLLIVSQTDSALAALSEPSRKAIGQGLPLPENYGTFVLKLEISIGQFASTIGHCPMSGGDLKPCGRFTCVQGQRKLFFRN